MSAIAELNEHLARYSKKLEEVWNEASFVARGFNLGIGTTPANHPCHMEFYEELGAWVNNFMAAEHTYEELRAVTFWLVEAAAEKESPTGKPLWFLFAAQGYAKPMIPLLTPEDRADLLAAYDRLYPRRQRLPIQKEVYKLLKK